MTRILPSVILIFGIVYTVSAQQLCISGTCGTVPCVNAPAITIVPTYDSSFTSDPQYTVLNTAATAMMNDMESKILVPVTLYFTFYAGSAATAECPSGALACNNPNFSECKTGHGPTPTYAQIYSALSANAKSATAKSAVASLPVSDPFSGETWILFNANCKVLGLPVQSGTSFDVAIYMMTSQNTFCAPQSSCFGSGKWDAYGAMYHEATEGMGRNQWNGTAGFYAPSDMYQFVSGVRDYVDTDPRYFSVDNGITNLATWYHSGSGGDTFDWNAGTIDGSVDSFNATASKSAVNPVSDVDYKWLDAIGYSAACGSSD